ncbi:NAD(P)/FAD-dependent oxidoreductase [Marinomonas spartinae]|uniref:NAD(P)/FAD-dependent oxidoreductase n=1 Tax=Marinomonas spartinae TaxID=1792290 RepID=UPI0018F21D08|nr:FAD-dependent oxidoreductase [Marinomonas spartinae]MBJ7552827.1 FAD-binding oxidoreductase [Marinomonas spartinae]
MYISENQKSSDTCVIGGGIVGLAISLGLLRNGHNVTLLDENDNGLRASRGNFGLVWVQGKGDTLPQYATITRQSAKLWKPFADHLNAETGIDIQLEQKGGLYLCLSEDELQARQAMLTKIQQAAKNDYPFSTLDLAQVREFFPEAGPEVTGATWCPEDGHLNPLLYLRAMTELFLKHGGKLVHQGQVISLKQQDKDFTITTQNNTVFHCGKVILAAGLGNQRLAPMVGLNAPVQPNRGQVLVSERVRNFLHYPTGHVRQTGEGTVQIGDSKEDVGLNQGTTLETMALIASRARKMFPILKDLRLVRAWGALRVMTPDGYPIYQQSLSNPGAYLVTCHSGVTLGAFHQGPLADWIANNDFDPAWEVFNANRFTL